MIKSAAGSARYIVQRKRVIGTPGYPKGSAYAIGLAYGEALVDVLKDDTLRIGNVIGANGWYGQGPLGDNYNPPVLDEREMLAVELALA